jgi:hypothetical protein
MENEALLSALTADYFVFWSLFFDLFCISGRERTQENFRRIWQQQKIAQREPCSGGNSEQQELTGFFVSPCCSLIFYY